MKNIREYSELKRQLTKMPRSSNQINSLFTADVEIIKLGFKNYLAITSDSIADEITFKLYKDPLTWGWMSIMASASDMAAAGVIPSGFMITNLWSQTSSKLEKSKVFTGIKNALRTINAPLLGGDTGVSHDTSIATTAFGISKSHLPPLTRQGICNGDYVALLEQNVFGIGPALAFGIVLNSHSPIPEKHYKPKPNPQLMKKIRPYCHASIDTSDGLAASLHILSELNQCHFKLEIKENLFSPLALNYASKNNISPLLLLLGDHGDYQTLITFPSKHLNILKKICGSKLVIIGKCVSKKSHPLARLNFNTMVVDLPIQDVQNCPRDLPGIIDFTKKMNKKLLYLYP